MLRFYCQIIHLLNFLDEHDRIHLSVPYLHIGGFQEGLGIVVDLCQ